MAREITAWWSERVGLSAWVEEDWRAGLPQASAEAIAAHVLTLTIEHPDWPWDEQRTRRDWQTWQDSQQ